MGAEVKFEITIHSGRLCKIFDLLKGTQNVYVQLVRILPDGREREFARTETCQGGDLAPKWDDEKFVVAKYNGKALALRIYCEHFWRADVLCGEVEVDLAELVARTQRGESFVQEFQLNKRGSPTGSLTCSLGPLAEGPCHERDPSAQLPSAQTFQAGLAKLLHRPEELEERVRLRFRQMAQPIGRNGLLAMRPEDCDKLRELLSSRLGVPVETFGEIHQMFWRFEVSGEGRLYEDEVVRMVLCMLHQYRDALQGPQNGSQQLGRSIKTIQLGERYEITRELGRGGQGVASLARNKSTNQQVVVKMYAKTNKKEAVEEISQEFELLLELKHPKIARVFEIFQDWSNVYIIQEPYFGGDLTKAVRNAYNAGVSVDERWVAEVMQQVLTACEFLHTKGVVHSDLKEPNVMVANHNDWRRPQVIVIDFGLANKFSSKSGVGGTPGYMPPEVWDWGLWTPRGDVFSIGVMLFTMRTGKGPFNSEGRNSIAEIKEKTRTEHPVMERGSPELRNLVNAMLNKQFLKRPTVRQILQDPWFRTTDSSQALDTQELHELVNKAERSDLYRALLADVAARQNMSQLKELNEMFMRLDVNNDGSISAEELRQGLAGVWRDAEVERLIAVLGINSGGEVSYDEFLGELLAAKEPQENALLYRIFKEADTNKQDFITGEELKELANRPAIVQILGSPEVALQKLQSMDPSGRGVVTFQMFKHAVQGSSSPVNHGTGMKYQKGQAVEYWSQSYGGWIRTEVTHVDAARGTIQLNCKPGMWLEAEQLHQLVRPAAGQEVQRGFREGQAVVMWSTTYSTWIPCKVTRVDAESGAVQVDQKPNYWLRGNELATRLRPSPQGASMPQPLNVGRAITPAARAGAGRQLLDAAMGGGGVQRLARPA